MDTKVMDFDSLSNKVIRAALNVHTALGPGLFEEVYKVCLRHELSKAGLKTLSEVRLPVIYDRIQLEVGYRIDLLVEDALVVELKSVEQLRPVHKAQLLTYLKLAHKATGLLLNFNTQHLKDGMIRVVNSTPTSRTSRPLR
jgi:GxxExxY protein